MSNNPKPFGTFHDAETGETIIRDLTAEEIAALNPLPQVVDDAE
jgi:hypothetical protein